MKRTLNITPITQARALFVMLLVFQAPVWADESTPSPTESNWVRVEDLEPEDVKPSTPATNIPLSEWDTTAPGVSSPSEASQVPSDWQFESRSVEEGTVETTVDPQTTFTF